MITGMGIDIKLIFAILAVLLAVFGSFLPYLRDIFKKKTKPHTYTWLIWTITQGVATAGLLYGNGGWGALDLLIGTFFVFAIFLISLKYGTRNITKSDTIILMVSLLAIIVWLQMRNPLVAVLMVTAIDFAGYLPSFRKSFQEPWTETVSSWLIFSLGNIFVILSLNEYNLLTLTYVMMMTVANIIIAVICLMRRRIVLQAS